MAFLWSRYAIGAKCRTRRNALRHWSSRRTTRGALMSIDLILGAITLVIVLVYLLAMLARPERD